MSVKKFCSLLNDAKVGKNDKTWFPRWVRRYASMTESSQAGLVITEGSVIKFSQALRDNGTPAWQRLQAVRAMELYRNLVLKTPQPSLHEIRLTLGRLADRERKGDSVSGVAGEQQLVGHINPDEPAVLQQMRREMRLRRLARETEKAYVGWIRRFVGFCKSESLEQFGEPQIKSVLTYTS